MRRIVLASSARSSCGSVDGIRRQILQSFAFRAACTLHRSYHVGTSNAPDPDTRVPRFTLPSMACDAHCHVFGPAARFPYASDRAYTPPDAPKERLGALH